MIQFPPGAVRDRGLHSGAPDKEDARLLYFAYTARIEPSKMADVAPGATFEFIAHLVDWAGQLEDHLAE